MTQTLDHRGSDASDTWIGEGLALGHTRLAIVDLTAAGAQPMVSPSGRYVVVYNGEVYNAPGMRDGLSAEGVTFRGHSDTEVLVAGFDAWGITATLQRSIGMFALAIWDRDERTLTLARDRIGQKPLYYGRVGDGLIAGSELKALMAHPGLNRTLDTEVVASFLRRGVVPQPRSIFQSVRQVPPGHTITWHDGDLEEPRPYWSVPTYAPDDVPLATSIERLDRQLGIAVERRLLADVPVGAFLSGGIDSTAIVAQMVAHAPGAVRTFTIGYEEREYDEADHAEKVAAHLGTDHTTFRVTPGDVQAIIPELPRMFDEPFADASQMPTHLVSRLAREHVTVALSGDGGDELFGGYNRHTWAPGVWDRLDRLPPSVRGVAGRLIGAVPPTRLDSVIAAASRVIGRSAPTHAGEKAHKVAGAMTARDMHEFYDLLVGESIFGPDPIASPWDTDGAATFAERAMDADLRSYLVDDILTKVDRASMWCSLEARSPFLDHEVVALSRTIPLSHKVQGTTGKVVLRGVVDGYVPTSLMDRPKAGFGVPIGAWLRHDLRPWAEALLAPVLRGEDQHVDAAVAQRLWDEHLDCRSNRQYELWRVLMWRAWREEWGV